MKLIRIETKGFKSFADKISLSFDGGVVGIVGPNGSGKSNINDAIKWVLGEQSIKSLRGDSADDVIFAGSKLMPSSDKAEVTLTFDNSEGKVKMPHKIITISRVIKRGGGSNVYYVNGNPARLKDIKEIAMESGIGKSSLAIISQGTISDIAEASPEERRGIFEEVAGVSKYKSRKKEALRKLDSTSEALEKVKAVVRELEKQISPLRRQAEKARIYLDKKSELKDVEIALIVSDVTFYKTKLRELNIDLDEVISTKEDLNARILSFENEIKEKGSYKLNLENDILELSSRLQDVSDKLRDVQVRSTHESQRRKMIIDGEIKIDDASRIKVMEEELTNLSGRVAKYKLWEEKSLQDINEKRAIVSKLQTDISSENQTISYANNKLVQLRAKLAVLIDHRDNKTNLFKGVKTIVNNKDSFQGYEGLVSELIEVEQHNRTAIEAILSNALQHIVVNNSETAVKAVNFLKANRGGRATFIPLNTIQPKGIREEHLMVLTNQDGFVGMAHELVATSPKHNVLKKFLLGNIIVSDTVDNATKIAKLLNNRYMVVSLDGDIVRSGGVVSGGEKQRSVDSLGSDDQIKRIEQSLPKLEEQIKLAKSRSAALMNSASEEQAIIAELNMETVRVREKKQISEDQYSSLKTTYEAQTKKSFKSEHAETESSDFLESEKSSIQALLKAKRESVLTLNTDLSQFNIQKAELEKSLREIIESSSAKMTEKSQAEYLIKTSERRLIEEYEMTVDAALDFKLDRDTDEARKLVSRLRSEIKELGHVNVDSIEMFEEVNARYEKLSNSEQELESAKQTILSAINEMDQIIISRLDTAVKSINKEFNNVFTKLLGGGFAEVKYTDPMNLLETGIDVIAQPPGKTVKNLRLFSGGEKAMIAISLLFAILRARPLPLCILDEVEAALDDANVVRFATYLQDLKEQTQFIVVTHRVGTMSRVDHLFGATMQNRGVTSFFTVKLSEAKKLIEE